LEIHFHSCGLLDHHHDVDGQYSLWLGVGTETLTKT
jgi:hypothetical protein